MANDIDPITGLPPMQFNMPQSQKVEEELTKKFEAGAGLTREKSRKSLDAFWDQIRRTQYRSSSIADPKLGGLGDILIGDDVTNFDWRETGGIHFQPHFIRTDYFGDIYKSDLLYMLNPDEWWRQHGHKYRGYEWAKGTAQDPAYQSVKSRYRDKYDAVREFLVGVTTPSISVEQAREQYGATSEGKLITGALESFQKERDLLSEISKVRGGAEQAMARELRRRLEGIEEQSGIEREFIGEQQTQRGMLRSSFTQEKIGESALREQMLKGQERVGTQSRIMTLRDAQQDLIKKIETDREQLLLIQDISEIQEIERKRNMMIESHLRTQFMQAMAQAQIDAAEKQGFMNTVTSLATTAVMAYAVSGCWVARAIFGDRDMRWLYARTYVIQTSPNWFYFWYIKKGEEFAKKVKKSKILKLLLKPLFIYFSFRGKKLWQSKT